MQNIDAFERDWRDRGLGRPLHREMTFTQAGLALGRGTLLAEFGKTAAYREPLAGGVIEKIRRAGEYWRAGDKALAQVPWTGRAGKISGQGRILHQICYAGGD
jgi:hypothetical protein